jgi:DNA-binding response OmpR family regulator
LKKELTSKMRLLVAEDERSLSKALTVILEKNKYSVDAAYDGEEALDYLSVGQYDGLILDIMMPKMDGITVLKKLRAKGNNIPVLMLTAKSEIDDRVTGLDCGANDYLTKPFDTKELLARIRAMTRGRSGAQSSVMTMGNISLDRTTYELSSPSGSFRLANKEFQVMELLMSNPKQLIPTELMMEKIWGFDSDSEISVVWAYISYLRKKLTVLNADIKIKASRNAGYSLEMVE